MSTKYGVKHGDVWLRDFYFCASGTHAEFHANPEVAAKVSSKDVAAAIAKLVGGKVAKVPQEPR